MVVVQTKLRAVAEKICSASHKGRINTCLCKERCFNLFDVVWMLQQVWELFEPWKCQFKGNSWSTIRQKLIRIIWVQTLQALKHDNLDKDNKSKHVPIKIWTSPTIKLGQIWVKPKPYINIFNRFVKALKTKCLLNGKPKDRCLIVGTNRIPRAAL